MTGPLEPVDIDSLVFVTIDGERRLGNPNRRDRELAERLMRDRVLWQYRDASTLATIIAAVREGSTLEGRRQLVSAHSHVGRHSWPDAEPVVMRQLWRRWVDELTSHGLRPVGWPSPIRTYLAYGQTALVAVPADPDRHPGMVEVPAEGPWRIVDVGLTCEAVPA